MLLLIDVIEPVLIQQHPAQPDTSFPTDLRSPDGAAALGVCVHGVVGEPHLLQIWWVD